MQVPRAHSCAVRASACSPAFWDCRCPALLALPCRMSSMYLRADQQEHPATISILESWQVQLCCVIPVQTCQPTLVKPLSGLQPAPSPQTLYPRAQQPRTGHSSCPSHTDGGLPSQLLAQPGPARPTARSTKQQHAHSVTRAAASADLDAGRDVLHKLLVLRGGSGGDQGPVRVHAPNVLGPAPALAAHVRVRDGLCVPPEDLEAPAGTSRSGKKRHKCSTTVTCMDVLQVRFRPLRPSAMVRPWAAKTGHIPACNMPSGLDFNGGCSCRCWWRVLISRLQSERGLERFDLAAICQSPWQTYQPQLEDSTAWIPFFP